MRRAHDLKLVKVPRRKPKQAVAAVVTPGADCLRSLGERAQAIGAEKAMGFAIASDGRTHYSFVGLTKLEAMAWLELFKLKLAREMGA